MVELFTKLFLLISISSFVCTNVVTAAAVEKLNQSKAQTLFFVVSARNLPGKDTNGKVDPFVKVFWGMDNTIGNNNSSSLDGKELKNPPSYALHPVDASEYLTDDVNPDWNRVFKVQWNEGSHQKLYFEIRDEDPLAPDDIVGDVYVDVDEYVEKGEDITVPLSEKGTLILKKTVPFSFTLSARNIPHRDEFNGLSDPYVQCFFRRGLDGKDIQFYTTPVMNNVENPMWNTPIEFANYQKKTDQYFHFKVMDHDSVTSDDQLGEAFVEIDAFVGHPIPKNLAISTTSDAALIISYLK